MTWIWFYNHAESVTFLNFRRHFDACFKNNSYIRTVKISQLTDLFSLYFLKFIGKQTGQEEHYWTNVKEMTRNAWAGYAFEARRPRVQIDLLLCRENHVIDVCE